MLALAIALVVVIGGGVLVRTVVHPALLSRRWVGYAMLSVVFVLMAIAVVELSRGE